MAKADVLIVSESGSGTLLVRKISQKKARMAARALNEGTLHPHLEAIVCVHGAHGLYEDHEH